MRAKSLLAILLALMIGGLCSANTKAHQNVATIEQEATLTICDTLTAPNIICTNPVAAVENPPDKIVCTNTTRADALVNGEFSIQCTFVACTTPPPLLEMTMAFQHVVTNRLNVAAVTTGRCAVIKVPMNVACCVPAPPWV